jgi:hypothetical protein
MGTRERRLAREELEPDYDDCHVFLREENVGKEGTTEVLLFTVTENASSASLHARILCLQFHTHAATTVVSTRRRLS